jgi:hypothetical protein
VARLRSELAGRERWLMVFDKCRGTAQPHGAMNWTDRAVIAALARMLPALRRLGLLITPGHDPALHRQLIAHCWTICEALGKTAVEAGMTVAWFTIEDRPHHHRPMPTPRLWGLSVADAPALGAARPCGVAAIGVARSFSGCSPAPLTRMPSVAGCRGSLPQGRPSGDGTCHSIVRQASRAPAEPA